VKEKVASGLVAPPGTDINSASGAVRHARRLLGACRAILKPNSTHWVATA